MIKAVPSAYRCQPGVGVREQIPWDKKGGHGQRKRSWTRAKAEDEQGLMMKDNSIGFIRGEKLLTDNTKVLIIMTRRGEMPLTELRNTREGASVGIWKDTQS